MGVILDLICGRVARRLDGPTVRFTDPGVSGAPVPPAGPTSAAGPAAADPPAASAPAATVDVAWPVGAGRHANNCLFLDDPMHRCFNSYGEPVRPGQDCYPSARTESLRSYAERRPDSWLTAVIQNDIPQEATR